MEMSGQAHILVTLPQGKSPKYALNRRMCGPHSWSECFAQEINLFPLLELETWIIQPVT